MIHYPKPYLSYSQFKLFRESPERYYKKYYENDEEFSSKNTIFGKWVHAELAKTVSKDPSIEMIRPSVMKGFTEEDVIANLGNIKLFGTIDIRNDDKKCIVDIKTSLKEWPQKKADNDEQLTFYSILVRQAFGYTPEKLIIHWIETAGDPLYLTGNNKEIITTREQWQLDMLEEEIKEVWEEIGIYCGERYNF